MEKKTFVIDADTLLVRAACACQQNSVIATHIKTGKWKEFATKSAFWGTKRVKKDGGWLAEQNAERIAAGKTPWNPDEFVLTLSSTLIEEDAVAFGRLKTSIEHILDNECMGDFRVVIGNKENFRYDVATVKQYKGQRPDKPLRFDAVKEYALRKYKDKVLNVDGIEADDVVAIMGWYGYERAVKAGDIEANNMVMCACDKDLYQVPGNHLNYLEDEKVLQWVGKDIAARRFWTQMLTGDRTDNIPGLLFLPDEAYSEFGVRKSGKGGIGDKTVEAVFNGLTEEVEYYNVVRYLYEKAYGDQYTYTTWDGKEVTKSWHCMMDEQYRLLRMMEKKGEFPTLESYERRLP